MICKIASKVAQAVAVVTLFSVIQVAQATSITVVNYSFEDLRTPADDAFLALPDSPLSTGFGGGRYKNYIAGWTTIAGTAVTWNPIASRLGAGYASITGENVGALNGGGSAMYQTVAPSLLANTEYKLFIDLFGRADGSPAGKFVPLATDYEVQLRAGSGSVILSSTSIPIAIGAMSTLTAIYTTGATVAPGPLSIWIIDRKLQLDFDNVRLVTFFIPPVPVPDGGSVTWIVGLGLGAFASFRRLRK